MRTFEKYVNQLQEGGNAVPGASRINQDNVQATLDKLFKLIFPRLGINKKDIGLLGSTGKKKPGESSGDVDVAINADALLVSLDIRDAKNLYNAIADKLKGKVKQIVTAPGFGTVSFAFPIQNKDGKQKNQTVQVDLMIVNNVKLANFQFWSPTSEESKYKGIYRNIMLSAVANVLDFKTIKTGYDEQGEEVPVTFERNFMDLKRGVVRGIQTRLGKTGKLFANGRKQTVSTKVLADTPEDIVQLLFGPAFGPEDVRSFEAILKLLTHPKFISKHKKSDILKFAAGTMNKIKGLVLPPELKAYV